MIRQDERFQLIFLVMLLGVDFSWSISKEKKAKIEERLKIGRVLDKEKADRVLVVYDGTDDEAKNFGEKMGWTWKRKVLSRNEFTMPPSSQEYDLRELRQTDSKVKSVEYEEYLVRVKKVVTVNDAQWSNQWNLQTAQSPSMNVYNAWNKGFTGSGITVAIVDDGIDVDHSDLVGNYVSSLSYDYIYSVADPGHVGPNDGHGTNCAGVVGAVKNSLCVIGVAYQASMPAIRILDDTYSATASDEAMALTHKLSNIDIYSNSWGPTDDGESMSSLPSVVLEAFEKGVTQGRNGKGAIYTWASGNGGENDDDCNADGYASNMYNIAIAAVSETKAPAYYAEHCSAIMAGTYSGDSPNKDITTTGPSNTCVNDFSGTSAACPVAAGIIALALQANSDLTWRDVQHMIVEHSTSSSLDPSAAFYTNGAGKQVSHWFGFGLMDAEALVDNAPTWATVPARTSCYSGKIDVQSSSVSTSIVSSYTATNCFIAYLEHVTVTIQYKASYRGYTTFNLLSPSGTDTKIFRSRSYDSSSAKTTWNFMSVHTWGEDPDGDWTLTMADANGGTSMKLYYWSITFYGTVTDPLSGQPAAGSLGGECSTSTDCSGVTDGGCLEDGLICVPCTTGYRIIGDYCKQDGRLGGYCNSSTPCFESNLECIDNICKTVSDEEKDNTAIIVGAVVGGTVGVAVLAVVGFFIYKKFFVAKATASVAPHSGYTPSNVYHPSSMFGHQPTSHGNPSSFSGPQPPLYQPAESSRPFAISGTENPAFQQ